MQLSLLQSIKLYLKNNSPTEVTIYIIHEQTNYAKKTTQTIATKSRGEKITNIFILTNILWIQTSS